jgi:acetylornithine deacetylase/succinyl-diaminopimelate desuccinylase-like protein
MPDSRTAAIQYAHQHRSRFLQELDEFLRFPSVSTDPDRAADVQRTAEWVAAQIKDLGFKNVQVFPTPGHPVVYGEYLEAGSKAPTVLVYGHYDVQPPDPLNLWESGPFEPDVRGENLFARGATDMKGQVMAALKALEAVLQTGKLGVNVKFLVEGEEEIGSPNLGDFITSHKDMLACDFALNPDSGIISPDVPTITYALRGLAYFELRVTGPDHDLHSGVFGGSVHNPAQVLCELIAGMHDTQGRVTLPGFYDKVRPLESEERAELARLPVGDDFFLRETGAPAMWGEVGYTTSERLGARPTLEVCGMLSGYTGAGSKTVLPSKAMAKISCRLVPDQDPDEVYAQMQSYLKAHVPPTVRYELEKMAGAPASISDRHSPWVQAIEKAMQSVWGVRPVFKREGGSVPVVGQFQGLLGVESVNVGFSLPGDNMHSPNEKLHLPTWYKGIDCLVHFFYNLSEK